jgi:3-hydroxyacyl-CoA dehydrogenase
MINEAIFVLGQGMASIEDIDKGCRIGLNHPMGPLELADFVGLDTCSRSSRCSTTPPATASTAPRRCW